MVIRAQKLARDSTISQLAAKVEEASVQKSKAGLIVDKLAKYYTPIVVISAVLLIVIPVILMEAAGIGSVEKIRGWVYMALVLLVCACPCAFVISTPVISICGISRAARQVSLNRSGFQSVYLKNQSNTSKGNNSVERCTLSLLYSSCPYVDYTGKQ